MSVKLNNSSKAVLALAATTLVWGSTFICVRELVAEQNGEPAFPPFLLLSIRFVIAALCAAILLIARREIPGRAAWRNGSILGLITVGGFAFQTFGLRNTTASRSAFITNVSLLLVPLFGLIAGRARPRLGFWAGCAVALGGLYILEFPWDADPALATNPKSADYLYGDLLTLGCAAFFAVQILATESFAPKTSVLTLVFVQFLSCGVASAVLGAATGELAKEIPFPNGFASSAWRVVYLGVVATFGCLFTQAWAQRYTSATRAALIFMLEPVFAAILAFIILGEIFSGAQWAGAALVFIGILAGEILESREKK